MDTLLVTLVVGMAVAFAVEFINNTLGNLVWWISPKFVRIWLTIPLAFGGAFLMGVSWAEIAVVTLASAFFSNVLLLLVDRASIINIRR